MTRVYIADAVPEERAALRLTLLDLNMEIVGETGNWSTVLMEMSTCSADMLVIDWKLLSAASNTTLNELRKLCPKALVIILISHLEARGQAALSVGADVFISKTEMPDRVAEQLRRAASKTRG